MLTEAGLPGWFPEDFSTDPALLGAFEDGASWHAAGRKKRSGNGEPGSGHQHAVTWDDLAAVIALTGDANHRHIPGSPDEWEHGYIPVSEAAARSHGHGKVPKGWHAPSGGGAKPTAKDDTPEYVKNFKNPATAAEDTPMRQAVKSGDYDTAVKHLQKMDALEKKAGVGDGEGMRPKIAGTMNAMKATKREKQREARELPKERGQQASRIATTAGQVITAQTPYSKTTPEQAQQVKASLREASNALMAGDHEGALRHLADAKKVAQGPKGTSVMTSGPDGRGAVYRIADHEKDVQSLADRAQSLAKFAPSAAKKAEPAVPRPRGTTEDKAGILSGSHPADRLTVASNPGAAAKGVSGDDLKAADRELARRAALLGKPGQMSRAHKAVAAEMQKRGLSGGSPKPKAAGAAPKGKPSAGNEKQLSLISERMQGGDKTSGEMKAGDTQEGHQAIAQAPVGILGNEKQRVVNGGNVKGSFSDPWWMAGPGGTFAVSQRWKSPAQASHQKVNGEWQAVKLPAMDERVLTPWSARAGKASALADRVASEHPAAAGHLREAAAHIALGSQEKAEASLRAAEAKLSGSHKSITAYAARNPSPEASRALKETGQHLAAVGSLRGEGGTAALAWTRGELAAALVELSAQTAQLERTPAPRGKPGGPGLYDVEGMGHTPYLQQVVKALIEKRGMDPHRAYAVARGAIRKWGRGGGKVHPEVRQAAVSAEAGEEARQARAHAHAVTWDDVARVIEMATVIELFNPAQPRLPVGPGGGQFAGGGAQPAGGQQPAGKAPAKAQPKPKPTAAQLHALHVAHVAHVNGVSTAKAGLLVTAQDDKAKAAALTAQRDALVKALASAGGKVSSGQAGAKTAKTAATKTTAPATAKAKAAAKPAAASTTTAKPKTAKTAAKTAAKAPAAAAKAGSAAAMKMQIASLNTQIAGLLAQAAQATAQAAKIR